MVNKFSCWQTRSDLKWVESTVMLSKSFHHYTSYLKERLLSLIYSPKLHRLISFRFHHTVLTFAVVKCCSCAKLLSFNHLLMHLFPVTFCIPCCNLLCEFLIRSTGICAALKDYCARLAYRPDKFHECMMQLNVSNLGATAVCIALTISHRHVNSFYCRFSLLRSNFTVKKIR